MKFLKIILLLFISSITISINAQNICETIGNDSLTLYKNGYITGPQSVGRQPIHTESKWINISGADSLYLHTMQHRLYDKSNIYDKNNKLIWTWGGESVPAITWYPRKHSLYVGGNDRVKIEFYQGYPEFSIGHLQVVGVQCVSSFTAPIRTITYKTTTSPPKLTCSNLKFNDNNEILEGNETSSFTFYIKNSGKGNANNVNVSVANFSNTYGIDVKNPNSIREIRPNDSVLVNIPITGKLDLATGESKLKISFTEKIGFPPDPFEVILETKAFEKPSIKIVDYSFITENGKIEKGEAIALKVLVQNVGQGNAQNVNLIFNYPQNNILPNSENNFQIPTLLAGESKEVVFEFMTNKLYTESTIPIKIAITEKYNRFAENKQVVATLNSNSSITSIKVLGHDDSHKIDIKEASLTSDVDKNIPTTSKLNSHKYALIIGNEDYSSKQSGLGSESNVEFAMNDAKVFYEYAIKTLGLPKENCFLLLNATSGEMTQKINVITQILTRLGNNSELIFFYAGHGHPEENTRIPYLIPVDVSATNLQSAIKVTDLYMKFAQTKTNRITVFLDACFTGGGRDQGLIASRAVKVVPKADMINGNMVRFSATSNEQSALPYKEKQHGMFTYFLLKKLQESKGQVTYQELSDYIKKEVSIESLKINFKEQDPQVEISRDILNSWGSWMLNN